ncbi:TetR/AcrR family transcriptional regulator [Bacillus cereus]|uniref:TetR/AcrR family transcriptional regulator n=1 Tax=Bacillus cereus TaxID=1396 RepID=UPI003981805A
MPKIVNHEQRRKKIVHATWKIICERGVEEVSVRKIAEEMKVSAGSLRYYFSTQNELLKCCMQMMDEAVEKRIQSLDISRTPLELVEHMLYEVLPLKKESQLETEVWISIVTYAQKHPDLQDLALKADRKLRLFIDICIEVLRRGHLLDETLEQDIEVTRLYAIVNGIALNWCLNKEGMSTEQIKKVLKTHLLSICKK